jgi:1-acyl-sn-glycerol-3-phosphate acyltransferase
MKTFAIIVTTIVFKLIFRVEVINRDKIPQKGPALLCANHNTFLDMFLLGYRLDRWIHWMAKEELFRNPITGFIFKKLSAFPVKRGTADVGSVKNAYRLLEEGKIVGIFPQGTRRHAGGASRVKSGAAMIAANAGVPIIPATVKGTYKLFSKMTVNFGDPFMISKHEDKLTKEELAEISTDIINRIYSLSGG